MRPHLRSATLAIAALIATSAVLGACSSNNPPDELTGKLWVLNSITEKIPAYQGVVPAEDQGKYSIIFHKDGTFSAKADCNLVGGSFKADKTLLSITLGPSTLVACPDGSYGDLFAHALGQAETWSKAADKLDIGLKDGGILNFTQGTAEALASAEAEASASPTPVPTATPKPTASPTPKPTASPTPTPAPTATPTPTPKPSGSAKPTATPTATPKPVKVQSLPPVATATPEPSPSLLAVAQVPAAYAVVAALMIR
jgi:heat shock protein HslJ